MSPADRPIVVAYDGSKASTRALEAAAKLFTGRKLLIVSVWEEAFPYYVPAGIDPGAVTYTPSYEEMEAVAQARHGAADRIADAGVELATAAGADASALPVADLSDVAHTLLDVAEEHDAAAFVVGSHGRGAVSAKIFGSVSQKLLHLARRPVLVVRAEETDD